jgi:hypothetical protein
MPLIRKFGEMWARNLENIKLIPGSSDGGRGVYVLYDGSIPVYIGKGKMRSQIRSARLSNRRKHFWDHFSWYSINDSEQIHDTEALLLRILPSHMLFLNRQEGNFLDAPRNIQPKKYRDAEFISRRAPKQK